ncbi:MAG: hypothetical protein HUU22_03300 [Phycisphaerae bacterium]|nr:hypothetical protein [Phycisphaerae bacterium]NUQ45042.1 hypothetical protein [Phycisphaerae bacterium]
MTDVDRGMGVKRRRRAFRAGPTLALTCMAAPPVANEWHGAKKQEVPPWQEHLPFSLQSSDSSEDLIVSAARINT